MPLMCSIRLYGSTWPCPRGSGGPRRPGTRVAPIGAAGCSALSVACDLERKPRLHTSNKSHIDNGIASRLMDNGVASRRMEIGVASRRMENGVASHPRRLARQGVRASRLYLFSLLF